MWKEPIRLISVGSQPRKAVLVLTYTGVFLFAQCSIEFFSIIVSRNRSGPPVVRGPQFYKHCSKSFLPYYSQQPSHWTL
jgi:hypothetical protein